MNKILAEPLISLGYIGSKLDRIFERRRDRGLIERAMQHDQAGVFALAGDAFLLKKRGDVLDAMLTPKEAAAFGEVNGSVFLGLLGEAGRCGISLAPEIGERAKASGEYELIDLRSIAVQKLADPHLAELATAKAVLAWHARHRFCSNCGTQTNVVEAGWRRDCPNCGMRHFPRTDPCVIMLVIDQDRCLLGRSRRFLPDMWSCLAGFVEPGESFEEAVKRETFEEAGLTLGRLSYFRSQPWPFPMSIMVGFHAEAKSTELNIDRNELEDARWFERAEVKAMLAKEHPDGLFTPPSIAIAHHILRAYADKGAEILGG